MLRRIRPALLTDNAYGNKYPSPKQRVLDLTYLNGGLNLWELDYRLDANQSSDCVNVYWKDGCLSSRQGQAYIYDSTTDHVNNYGNLYACYEREWHGYMIAHKGTKLYKIVPSGEHAGEHTVIYSGTLHEAAGGSFFVFGDKLYYMDGYEYIVINSSCVASNVVGYIPTTIVSRSPDGTTKPGTQNEDENRIAAGKKVEFIADGTSTSYYIPEGYLPMDETAVAISQTLPTTVTYHEVQTVTTLPTTGVADIYYEVSGTYYLWNGTSYDTVSAPSNPFSVNRTTGVITFTSAPAASSIHPSNVVVTVYKENTTAMNAILKCRAATVYGADTALAVVCGGPTTQPNAYFWSGSNTANGLDPTYFPFDYYNYAGASADEAITGFGKQQSMLVIFKEKSIGKSYFEVITYENDPNAKEYLKLPYKGVNEVIGCDIEKSIRLVQNNLFFANKEGGVYVLLDSTAYGENTVKRLSRNINGDVDANKGLLYDLRQVASTAVTSFDDSQRYWITANGHAYLMDYTLKGIGAKEENLSWFFFDKIRPMSWFKTISDTYYGLFNGSVSKFIDEYNDYGEIIARRYTFATQNFGTYEVLKDVLKVIFAVRSDTDSAMTVVYKTDYEVRTDKTPVRAYTGNSWRLVPRDLHLRNLSPLPFAATAVRKPRCLHIRHFQMTLTNNTINTDMSIVSAQIVYRFVREDR